jgi:hypothetical protein
MYIGYSSSGSLKCEREEKKSRVAHGQKWRTRSEERIKETNCRYWAAHDRGHSPRCQLAVHVAYQGDRRCDLD